MQCGTGMSHRKSPIGDKAGANIRTVAVILMMMVRDQWSYQLMHRSRALKLSSSKRISQLDIHWSSYQSVRKVKDAKMENTLSIVFGCEQCRQCQVKEQEAQFEYNLKLLEVIVKKSLGKAPPRIQLALLRLQYYQFNAGNKAGKSIHIARSVIYWHESSDAWWTRGSLLVAEPEGQVSKVQSKLQTFPGHTLNLQSSGLQERQTTVDRQNAQAEFHAQQRHTENPGKKSLRQVARCLKRESQSPSESQKGYTTDDTHKLPRNEKEQTNSWWYPVLVKHDNRN